ncbi:hypothetical protein [Sediminicoccus sp. KRV36]|uniref:hypothetical protein n=1 Tax=Sediminicoccus sp. KRV36 TaxID=3133721 RepID=UPI00200FFC8D|nr:hypothetical protein [Sediminicoccus rosea]UPY37307.1 hypothetical protein LHU95_01055 [Sediminicoccus rosea]
MRPLHLSLLAATLAACANTNPGINATGGDGFVLDVQGLSGTRAVESGLAQAQSFCGEHGRLFVMTNSQVGSSSYRLEFRCIGPANVLPPPPVVASAPPPAPSPVRGQGRGRRGAPAPAPEITSNGPPLAYGAVLPPLAAPIVAPPWSPGTANIQPVLPPVATTPLFAPPAGTMLSVAPLTGPRLPPPDNSPLVALPRLDAVTTPETRPAAIATAAPYVAPAAAAQPVLTREPLPPVGSLPLLQSQPAVQPAAQPMALPPASSLPMVQAQPLPPIQAQPVQPAYIPLSAPPASFGTVVPSPTPLPGAPSSLPPIAGGSTRPVPLPGGSGSGFSSNSSSFTQGVR